MLVNFGLHFVSCYRFDPKKSENDLEEDHLFRTYQVFHRHVSEFVAQIITGLIIMSSLIQVIACAADKRYARSDENSYRSLDRKSVV